MKNVLIVGIGYVGLAQALLLRDVANVYGVDIDEKKVDDLSKGNYVISDLYFQKAFPVAPKINASTEYPAIKPDFILLCLPTDFDEKKGDFNTLALDAAISECLKRYDNPTIIIKSTVPIGYTSSKKNEGMSLLFSPEFLRESSLYEDVVKPSRIIIGYDDEKDEAKAQEFLSLLLEGVENKDVPTLLVTSMEAEAIKLFSNEYLAMRIAYFNELDNYALKKGLRSKAIIEGVSLDPRIGNFYNNPSFGYGGYCLPKDTKALLSSYGDIPEDLLSATILANEQRKKTIAEDIRSKAKGKKIGFYRLSSKKGSDNFRSSPIMDLVSVLKDLPIYIYEPSIDEKSYNGVPVIKDFDEFASSVDLIIASRIDDLLAPYLAKVYTRDVSHRD